MLPPDEKAPPHSAVSRSLRRAALGQLAQEYLSSLPREAVEREARSQAEAALGEIWAILENPALDDPACMQKIEAVLTVYYRRLGVRSTRHWEQD